MRSNRRSNYLFGMILVAVVLSTGSRVLAQAPPPAPSPAPASSPTPSLERQFFKNILLDQKAIWTAPLHLDRDDSKWMVPLGLGSMALITTDRITGDEVAESTGQVNASRIISYAGSGYAVGAVAATFYLVGRKNNDDRARETGILCGEAAVDSLIVVSALKGITQRGRPHSGIDRSEFFDSGNSFPSGHSAAAWTVATIVANEYHDHRMAQIAAYGIASAVSISRFTGGKHYLSDVLVGSALGFGIGQYVYHAHHRKNPDSVDEDEAVKGSRWPAITPRYSRRTRQYGIGLTWGF